jgi:hypothetical protein
MRKTVGRCDQNDDDSRSRIGLRFGARGPNVTGRACQWIDRRRRPTERVLSESEPWPMLYWVLLDRVIS